MQQRGPRMGQQGFGMGQGWFAPQMLLHQRDRLDLTDDQVERLETLATEMREAHQAAAEATEPRVERLRELWDADQPDVNAIQSEMRALADARHAAALAGVAATAQAKALLTAEQRGRIDGWMDGRRMAARRFNGGPGWRHPHHQGYRMGPPIRRD
jgi:Spy/CpxP family protein refolding chaperone